jgi:integrase
MLGAPPLLAHRPSQQPGSNNQRPASSPIDTGMRPEENSRLRWESIGWSNGQYGALHVTHGKTAAARRMLPLSPRVRALLERRWEVAKRPSEGWVWATATASGHIAAPAGAEAQWCASLCALRSQA